MRGRFITLEGGEGAGKSTQGRLLVQRLAGIGVDALGTREPGGTPLAERFRAALLSGAIAQHGAAAEAIVFSAARIDHLDNKILPALERGQTVVCDRFVDSTRAYQGVLGHLDVRVIAGLERVVVGTAMPDVTLILDLPAETGLARAAARRGDDARPDRFEQQERAFHDGLRRAYLGIAAREPARCVVVDASLPEADVAARLWDIVVERLFPDQRVDSPAAVPSPG